MHVAVLEYGALQIPGFGGVATVQEIDLHNIRNALRDQVLPHLLHLMRLDPKVVLEGLNGLPAVGVLHEHAAARGAGGHPLAPADVPRVAQQQLEVVVVVRHRAHVVVVLAELPQRHGVRRSFVGPVLRELLVDVLGACGAAEDLRVMVGVVQLQHLGHQDGSGPFRVQLLERLTHQLAPGVHGQATDPREQLPRFDYPGAVAVKEVHELVHLLRSGVQPQVLQSCDKSVLVQLHVAVWAQHVLQRPGQRAHAPPPVDVVQREPHKVHGRQSHRLQAMGCDRGRDVVLAGLADAVPGRQLEIRDAGAVVAVLGLHLRHGPPAVVRHVVHRRHAVCDAAVHRWAVPEVDLRVFEAVDVGGLVGRVRDLVRGAHGCRAPPIVLSHNRILVAHGLLHQEDGGLSLFESIPPGPEGVRVALEAGVVPLGARQRQGRGHVRIILGVCHVTCALAPTRGLCTHDAVRVALGAQLDVVVVRVEAQSGRAREARLSCVFQRDMEQWVLEVKANRIGGAVLREWVSRGTFAVLDILLDVPPSSGALHLHHHCADSNSLGRPQANFSKGLL
mmetsp:Transcript_56640/g.94008  ORF Transcript_56640/g.94008 Transcript_56640/m.94008 type:complete len:561 (+) Transcript_56640:2635-4317(+)